MTHVQGDVRWYELARSGVAGTIAVVDDLAERWPTNVCGRMIVQQFHFRPTRGPVTCSGGLRDHPLGSSRAASRFERGRDGFCTGFLVDFIRNTYILSKTGRNPYWILYRILYWMIGGFYLNSKSSRFYVEFTGFPHLASYSNIFLKLQT